MSAYVRVRQRVWLCFYVCVCEKESGVLDAAWVGNRLFLCCFSVKLYNSAHNTFTSMA